MIPPAYRIFLLSPAHAGGLRARMLLRSGAQFELALRLRQGKASIGEVFAFLSGLYFRGKLAYATAFAHPPRAVAGLYVITTDRGLIPADTLIDLSDLAAFAKVSISESDERYRIPLEQSARRLQALLPAPSQVILLGSIATGKYVDVLSAVFTEKLLFPDDFVGRGDMSRGGLMLRSAASGEELSYRPIHGAARRGPRPPRLSVLASKKKPISSPPPSE